MKIKQALNTPYFPVGTQQNLQIKMPPKRKTPPATTLSSQKKKKTEFSQDTFVRFQLRTHHINHMNSFYKIRKGIKNG